MPLSGPHVVSRQLQIKIPVKLARALHIEPGDEVFWYLSDDDGSALTLTTAEAVERRYSIGRQLERLDPDMAAELPAAQDRAMDSGPENGATKA